MFSNLSTDRQTDRQEQHLGMLAHPKITLNFPLYRQNMSICSWIPFSFLFSVASQKIFCFPIRIPENISVERPFKVFWRNFDKKIFDNKLWFLIKIITKILLKTPNRIAGTKWLVIINILFIIAGLDLKNSFERNAHSWKIIFGVLLEGVRERNWPLRWLLLWPLKCFP